MNLDAKLEAILFWKNEPVSVKKLAELMSSSEDDITKALTELDQKLAGRGVQLLYKDNEVMIGTRAELGPLIETLIKEELVKDLGKAGLETLSVILYRGPVSRRDIDYIRGVNSNFILRNLLIRGLIEKIPNPKDQRSFIYQPTFELLGYLGISKLEELPEYFEVQQEINQYHREEQHAQSHE